MLTNVNSVPSLGSNLFSGAYPSGCCTSRKYHADINHDASGRIDHDVAFKLAKDATSEWVKKWFNIYNDALTKAFAFKNIIENNASPINQKFRLILPTLALHLDGKAVNASLYEGIIKSKLDSLTLVPDVLIHYFKQYRPSENKPYPSVYWKGFIIDHIQEGMAKDLIAPNTTP